MVLDAKEVEVSNIKEFQLYLNWQPKQKKSLSFDSIVMKPKKRNFM